MAQTFLLIQIIKNTVYFKYIVVPATGFKVEDLLQTLLTIRDNPRKKKVKISEEEVRDLCKKAEVTFLKQPSLLKIPAPVKICGDIHGQYFDLLNLFDIGGAPPKTRYLFLGDYVDRGKNSLETICLLLSLKVVYPESFFLIRGNHESAPMNRVFGFHSEICRRFKDRGQQVYETLNKCFNHMPIAAVVNGSIFCCHGGIGPDLIKVGQINRLKRPMLVPENGWIQDVMWSDPDGTIDGWEKQDHPEINAKHRGCGWLFGRKVLEKFLKANKLKMIARAHQCIPSGYQWYFKKQLVTVFSAPDYSLGNVAAIMCVRQGGSIGFQKFD